MLYTCCRITWHATRKMIMDWSWSIMSLPLLQGDLHLWEAVASAWISNRHTPPMRESRQTWLKKFVPETVQSTHLFDTNVDVHTLSKAPSAKWHGLCMSLQPLIISSVSSELFARWGHRSMDLGLPHPNRYWASRNHQELNRPGSFKKHLAIM